MGVHSGKHGVVHIANAAEKYVRNWSITDTMAPEVYVASNTRGGQFANPGVEDYTGAFSGFGGIPGIFPGDIVAFEGYTTPLDDIYGNDGKVYSGNVIIDSLTINWNWGASQTLDWSATFSCADAAAIAIADGFIDDLAVTLPEKMCGLKVEYADDGDIPGAYASWDNLTSAVLNITSANVPYVNSTTGCFTGRKAGNITWGLGLTEQEEAQLIAKGTNNRLRLYVDGVKFWLLEFGRLTDYTNLTVDRETGAIISKTANYVMNGSSGTALGSITDPDAAVKWPIPST